MGRRRRAALTGLLSAALFGSTLALAVVAQASTKKAASLDKGITLNIGDQEQDLQTLFASSGQLEGAPYKVNFIEFDRGPLVDAGFAAHRIDAGFMGDLPATVSVSSHLPLKAVAVSLGIGANEFLVARPGITSISQLRGKPVAYTTGTAEQAFALRALATAGLTQKNVTQVDVTLQQLGTVIESGSADASVLSIERKVDYLQSTPKAVTLATNTTVQPRSYLYVLADDSALANRAKAQAIWDFIGRLVRAEQWARKNPAKWTADYYVDVEHQSPSAAKLILAAGGLENYVPLTSAVQAALQNVVDLMASAGAIPKRFTVGSLFDPKVEAEYQSVLDAS